MNRIPWACALLAAPVLLAQHTYTPADVEDGGRLYRSTCAGCHGQTGTQVAGVDLAHGKYRRASTDDGLIQIIRTGIPGTAMPPNNFTEFQAGTIVAYLHSLAANATAVAGGDAARGKEIFEGKGACLTCHTVTGNGSRSGPDLTDIGTLRAPAQLENSILDPDAEIAQENRTIRLITKSGATVTGRIMNIDTFGIALLDSQGRLRSFAKSDLRDYTFESKSPMPSYRGKLSPTELADLVSYLVSLKGVN